MYPIVIERRGVIPGSQGFGEYEGAPAVGGVFYPLDHDTTIVYAADGTAFPPRGVLGGGDGGESASIKVAATVNRGWLSPEEAERVYKVALKHADEPGLLAVDEARTATLRAA